MCHHNRIFNIVNIITHSYTAYYIILLPPLSLIETNYKNRTTMTNIWRTKNMFLLFFYKSIHRIIHYLHYDDTTYYFHSNIYIYSQNDMLTYDI